MPPPALKELLDYPEYRKYFLQTPHLPPHLATGNPYDVWGRREQAGKVFWRYTPCPTYRESIKIVSVMLKTYEDACVVSRRRSFAMPDNLKWIVPADCDWCKRCRRPTIFGKCSPRHHALRKMPVLDDITDARCHYCGGRQATFGG